jgi:hypothetical protein
MFSGVIFVDRKRQFKRVMNGKKIIGCILILGVVSHFILLPDS